MVRRVGAVVEGGGTRGHPGQRLGVGRVECPTGDRRVLRTTSRPGDDDYAVHAPGELERGQRPDRSGADDDVQGSAHDGSSWLGEQCSGL